MNLLYAIIYQPQINKLLRNINYVVSPLLPPKIKLHPSGVIKVNLEDLGSVILKTNQTSFLTRELFWKGAERFEYTSIFLKLIKDVDTFMDIGSNMGYYSILACKANPNISVIAFEPSEGPLAYARENTKINGFNERILIEPIALSDTVGTIDFFNLINPKFPTIHNLSGEHNTGTKIRNSSNKIKVASSTLDHYFEKNNLKKIDLIKIDTEGTEPVILNGGIETIKKNRPIVICETLFNTVEADLETFFLKQDYALFNHNEKKNVLELTNTIQRNTDNGVRNCFFVPNEKKNMVSQFL